MNKKTFLVTAILGLIFVGGAAFGFYTWKMNANSFKGIAVPVKGLPDELCEKWETAFQEVLSDDAVLQEIADETEYADKLGVPAGEAVSHLKGAVKVRFVKRKGSIEVGIVGKRKQNEALSAIADILYKKAVKEVVKTTPSFQQYLDVAEQAKERAKAGSPKPESE